PDDILHVVPRVLLDRVEQRSSCSVRICRRNVPKVGQILIVDFLPDRDIRCCLGRNTISLRVGCWVALVSEKHELILKSWADGQHNSHCSGTQELSMDGIRVKEESFEWPVLHGVPEVGIRQIYDVFPLDGIVNELDKLSVLEDLLWLALFQEPRVDP